MTANAEPEPAAQPEDLGRYFLERANAGDVEGLIALYQPGAVLAFPPGKLAVGHEQIREVYAKLLADRPSFGPAGPAASDQERGSGAYLNPPAWRRRYGGGSTPPAG